MLLVLWVPFSFVFIWGSLKLLQRITLPFLDRRDERLKAALRSQELDEASEGLATTD